MNSERDSRIDPEIHRVEWHLLDRGFEVARLMVTGGDFPWLTARVEATAGFAAVRPLFEEELLAFERVDDDPTAADAAYERIRERMTLVDPDGRAVPEFMLSIDGDEAWWR